MADRCRHTDRRRVWPPTLSARRSGAGRGRGRPRTPTPGLQGAQARVASLQSARQLLNADVWAYRAAVALDNRNFGVANDAVAGVVASLSAVDAAAAGVDGGSLASVKTEAAGVRISVATNLETQRAQIIRLADDIGALSGPPAKPQRHDRTASAGAAADPRLALIASHQFDPLGFTNR